MSVDIGLWKINGTSDQVSFEGTWVCYVPEALSLFKYGILGIGYEWVDADGNTWCIESFDRVKNGDLGDIIVRLYVKED